MPINCPTDGDGYPPHVFVAHLHEHLSLPGKVLSLQSRFPRKNFAHAESMEEVRAVYQEKLTQIGK